MTPEFIQANNAPVNLQPIMRPGKDKRLPGSVMLARKDKKMEVTVRHWDHPLFSIGYRVLQFFQKFVITIKEQAPGIRLEAVLAGELMTAPGENNPVHIKEGQYRLADNESITALFKKGSACHYFVTHYSHQLLQQAGITALVKPSPVTPLTGEMKKLIQQILHNPVDKQLRAFHYDNCVRELLRLHLSNDQPLPGK